MRGYPKRTASDPISSVASRQGAPVPLAVDIGSVFTDFLGYHSSIGRLLSVKSSGAPSHDRGERVEQPCSSGVDNSASRTCAAPVDTIRLLLIAARASRRVVARLGRRSDCPSHLPKMGRRQGRCLSWPRAAAWILQPGQGPADRWRASPKCLARGPSAVAADHCRSSSPVRTIAGQRNPTGR